MGAIIILGAALMLCVVKAAAMARREDHGPPRPVGYPPRRPARSSREANRPPTTGERLRAAQRAAEDAQRPLTPVEHVEAHRRRREAKEAAWRAMGTTQVEAAWRRARQGGSY